MRARTWRNASKLLGSPNRWQRRLGGHPQKAQQARLASARACARLLATCTGNASAVSFTRTSTSPNIRQLVVDVSFLGDSAEFIMSFAR
jgi:hypothetical protein